MSLPKENLKFKIYNLKLKSAFTLIELLVVISIIAILIAVATVSYTNAQEKGRDNKRKSDLKAVQTALEVYFQQNGKYPSTSSGTIQCNIVTPSDTTTHSWNSAFTCNTITYMNPLPKDPTNSPAYYYDTSSPYSTYKLYAKLENANDKDLVNAPASCSTTPPSGGYGPPYYCVINP